MSKSKWTPEQKIAMVRAYLSGEGSYVSIAKANGIAHTSLEFLYRNKITLAILSYGFATAGNNDILVAIEYSTVAKVIQFP